ncbi:MAG TPA: hypothetical protein VFV23_07060 [Verrucomicrobiae bacterium]|nr:hypothetical protein [Verrucomicrobiae bacterium]
MPATFGKFFHFIFLKPVLTGRAEFGHPANPPLQQHRQYTGDFLRRAGLCNEWSQAVRQTQISMSQLVPVQRGMPHATRRKVRPEHDLRRKVLNPQWRLICRPKPLARREGWLERN